MKHAKLFSILVAAVIGLYGAAGFYLLPLAGFQGDLTRVGLLPESLFGWTMPQPAIEPALLKQASWQEADVLVIGDSFSESGIWQMMLTRHGLKVHTEHWNQVRDICGDFSPWLRAQGFRGQYVVLQIIERNAQDGINRSIHCEHMAAHLSSEDKPRLPPPTQFNPDAPDYSGRISIGFKVRENLARYEKASTQPGFTRWDSGGINVVRLPQGCLLFSHRRCEDVLFLGEDRAEDLDGEVIRNMEILNGRFAGFKPIWAIVPNKSTAYLYPDKQFWNKAAVRTDSANLLDMAHHALAMGTVDLYPANNTHFSTTGYLIMGEEIYRHIRHQADPAVGKR